MDAALIRPGRVDVKEKIDYCTSHQLEQMYLKFYPDEPDHKAKHFSKGAEELNYNISAAQVQGFFMFYKSNPQGAIDNVADIVNV